MQPGHKPPATEGEPLWLLLLGTTTASESVTTLLGSRDALRFELPAGRCPGSRLRYVILNSADLSPAGFTPAPFDTLLNFILFSPFMETSQAGSAHNLNNNGLELFIFL